MAKAYLKIEKLQPRSFQIASLIQQISNGIAVVKAMNGIDYHIQKDAEMFQHLTGKVEDKTAGRNQLGFRPGK